MVTLSTAHERTLSGAAGSGGPAFADFERTLWRTIARLCKRGYFIPPDEARDLIHDFYLDGWPGLLERYDSEQGSFETYLVGAFYRFGQRKAVERFERRSNLVDLAAVENSPAKEPSPLDLAQAKQEVESMQSALASLKGSDRQLLYEHASDGRPSERELAERHHTSRHAIRRRLASGLENLARAFSPSGLTPKPAVPSAANSSPTVDALVLKSETSEDFKMAHPMLQALLLDDDREQAQYALQRQPTEVARILSSEGVADLRFSDEELRILSEHPERLGELYEAAFPHEHDTDEVGRKLKEAEERESQEYGVAMDALLAGMPGELLSGDWIVPRTADRGSKSIFFDAPAKATFKQILSNAGLTADVIVDAVRGLQVLCDLRCEDATFSPIDGEKPAFVIAMPDRKVLMTVEDLTDQVMATPGFPYYDDNEAKQKALAGGFVRWMVAALRVKPWFIPGYAAIDMRFAEQSEILELGPLPAMTLGHDLAARWGRKFGSLDARHRDVSVEKAQAEATRITAFRPGRKF